MLSSSSQEQLAPQDEKWCGTGVELDALLTTLQRLDLLPERVVKEGPSPTEDLIPLTNGHAVSEVTTPFGE